MFLAMHDLSYALRQLRKAPGFVAAAVLTLALGIGANTAMFTIIDSVLVRPLAYPEPHRLVTVGQADRDGQFGPTSWLNIHDVQSQSKTLAGVAGYAPDTAILQAKDSGKTVLGTKVTCNLLDVLRVRPLLGQGFSAADCAEGAGQTVLLSETIWRQEFAANPHIVGQTVLIGNTPHVVLGVMPARFTFPEEAGAGSSRKGIWLPSQLNQELRRRSLVFYGAVARLRPGASLTQARAELSGIAANLRRSDPEDASNLALNVRPYRETITGTVQPVFYALAAALGLVLLIACANVANLQLSRCLTRQQEFAVRAALGASKGRLMAELAIESALLSLLGAVSGLFLAQTILRTVALLPEDLIPRANEIELRWGVLAALAGLSALATLLSAALPSLVAMRTEPQSALRGAGRGISHYASRSRAAGWIVMGEVALAGVLLVAGSLLFHTLYNLQHKPMGFEVADVVSFTATPPTSAGYLSIAQQQSPPVVGLSTRTYAPLLEALRALPGVRHAALSSSVPFDDFDFLSGFFFEGRENRTPAQRLAQHAAIHVVSGSYLQVLGTSLVKGRPISDSDTEQQPFVVVVNQSFVNRFLPSQDPLQKRLFLTGRNASTEKSYTVVGVVADSVQGNIADPPQPEMIFSYRQIPETSLLHSLLVSSAIKVVLRTDPGKDLGTAIQATVRKQAPGFAIDNLQTMQASLDKADFNQRLGLYLIEGFAAVAVLMVVIGLYGVLAQLVSQRRQEIGIRVALGATRRSIVGLVLSRGVILIGAGTAAGLLTAGALRSIVQPFLYGITPLDVWAYFATAAMLLTVGLIAAWIPARRAVTLEPLEALRMD